MKEKAKNQRLLSFLVTVFHVVTAIHFCFAIYYDYLHVNVDASVLKVKRTQFGGKFKFLTFINCVSAMSTLAFALNYF